jgi:hypothetical protein
MTPKLWQLSFAITLFNVANGSSAQAQDWLLYGNLPTITFQNYLSVRGIAPKSNNKRVAIQSAKNSCQEALDSMRLSIEPQSQVPIAYRVYVSKISEQGATSYEGDCDIRTLDRSRLP